MRGWWREGGHVDHVAAGRAGRRGGDVVDWRIFSLAQAMRSLEDEPSPYTEDDIKEGVS